MVAIKLATKPKLSPLVRVLAAYTTSLRANRCKPFSSDLSPSYLCIAIVHLSLRILPPPQRERVTGSIAACDEPVGFMSPLLGGIACSDVLTAPSLCHITIKTLWSIQPGTTSYCGPKRDGMKSSPRLR